MAVWTARLSPEEDEATATAVSLAPQLPLTAADDGLVSLTLSGIY